MHGKRKRPIDQQQHAAKLIKPISLGNHNAFTHGNKATQSSPHSNANTGATIKTPGPAGSSQTAESQRQRSTVIRNSPVHKKGPPKFHKTSKPRVSRSSPDTAPAPAPALATPAPQPSTSGNLSSPSKRSGKNKVPAPYHKPAARYFTAPEQTPSAAPVPTPGNPGTRPSTPQPAPAPATATRLAIRRPRAPEFQDSCKRARIFLPRGVKRQTSTSAPPKATQKKARIESIILASKFTTKW